MSVRKPEVGRQYVVVGNETEHSMELFSICKVVNVSLTGTIKVEQNGDYHYVSPNDLACKKKNINYAQ